MKKIFSLFIIAAMILTMSITTFAATVSGMKTTITETDTDITVTVTVGNVVSCSTITHYLITDKVTFVDGSAVVGTPFDGATVTPTTNKSGYIKYVLAWTDAAKYITNSGEFVALTYKVAKTSDDVELSASDFTYGTSTLNVSKVGATGSVAGVDTSTIKQITSKTHPDNFTVEYVDNRTKAGWTETGKTVDGEDVTVTVKFPTTADEKAGAESSWTGNASTQASKKAVKFGKNETGAKMLGATVENGKLVVNNADYFVEYDGKKYYGLIDVEAGKSWAILIIESVSAN